MKHLIFGLGKSGNATAKYLARREAVIVSDDKIESFEALKNIPNIQFKAVDEINWEEVKDLILTPGVPLNHPEPHKIVALARKNNKEIYCDIELFARELKSRENSKIIGITGTNGKSTTTALTYHIFKSAGANVELGGNIGFPVMELPVEDNKIYVFEISSFMLDLMPSTCVNTAIITNVTPDHIDRHGTIENYIESKKQIFNLQNEGDFAILNLDNDVTQKIYDARKNANENSKLIGVSLSEKHHDCFTFSGEEIFYNGLKYHVGVVAKLPGDHNKQNIVCAFAAAFLNGINSDEIIKAIHSFGGLQHRMQTDGTHKNIRFVNDSKATNADSTSHALKAFDNIFWLAGGVAKDGGIETLVEFFPKISKAYLFGKCRDDFAKTLDEFKLPYVKFETMKEAFFAAAKDASSSSKPSPVVLLSPATASFDQFKNFEHRGEVFEEMVEGL
jgi:UDP-N-acetylmuramoylalanine--D-glutamate ligase